MQRSPSSFIKTLLLPTVWQKIQEQGCTLHQTCIQFLPPGHQVAELAKSCTLSTRTDSYSLRNYSSHYCVHIFYFRCILLLHIHIFYIFLFLFPSIYLSFIILFFPLFLYINAKLTRFVSSMLHSKVDLVLI